MKSFNRKILFLITVLFVLLLPVDILKADTIDYFNVDIRINTDNTANITETINYNFSVSNRHGIYRKIPEVFRAEGNIIPINIKVESVTDENGVPYQFTNNSISGVDLKIGDPDEYANSRETYVIKYKVKNPIGFFEENDELYWNLTGNEWDVESIENVHATIKFPENIEGRLKGHSYCGSFGSSQSCGEFSVINNIVDFDGNQSFQRDQGVTIDLEFEKGIVLEPSNTEKIMSLLIRYYFVLVALIIAILIFKIFFRLNLDTTKAYKKFTENHPDMVQYDPGNFSLIEASFFHDGKTSVGVDLAGFIVWGAVNRYIKIIEKDGSYFFEKLESLDSLNTGPEKELLEKIVETKIVKILNKNIIADKDRDVKSYFSENSKNVVKDFNKMTNNLFNLYAEKVLNSGYIYPSKVEKVNKKISKSVKGDPDNKVNYFIYITFNKPLYIGILMFLSVNPGSFFLIINEFFYGLGYIPSLISIFLAIFILFFIKGIPAYTEKGMEASWYIAGLYKYIDMSEKDRIKAANLPEKTPALFERLLPYAMVFGLEDKWTNEFKDIYDNNDPEWIEADSLGVLNLSVLSNSIESSMKASSGGSSGGGGFSGGGGGGGGGGSW